MSVISRHSLDHLDSSFFMCVLIYPILPCGTIPSRTLIMPAAPITIIMIPPRVNAVLTLFLMLSIVALSAAVSPEVGIALYTVTFMNRPMYRNTEPTIRAITDVMTMPKKALCTFDWTTLVAYSKDLCVAFRSPVIAVAINIAIMLPNQVPIIFLFISNKVSLP